MEENLEKKLALLDFLDIDYFKKDDEYYYGESYDEDEDLEEVLEYKKNNNPDCDECDNYLVLDDVQAEQIFNQCVDNYIDDCVLSQIPDIYHQYFNWNKFKDGFDRGGILAHYNGVEEQQSGYYIYKIN
jgi:hypothetical protein